MKGNYTKQYLAEKLKKAIYEIDIDTRTQEDLINKLSKKGFDRGYVSAVLEVNHVIFDELSLIEIGVFALEIFKISGVDYINPEKYLEDIELEKVQNYKIEFKQDVFDYPVVFEDVRQVSDGIWTVVVTADFIAKLGRSNMLNYEFETQREAKTIETDDGIILTPTVNTQSVVEIEDEILTNNFIPNTLTFNIPLKDRDNFKYDDNIKRWILLKGKLNIIDGYHRYLGITSATRKQKLNYNFELRLTNFNDDKAKKFIVQEDKKNPISKEYIKSIDNSDLITQIISQLNQSNRSELNGKITTDKSTIRQGYALVSFNLMHKTMKNLWNPVTIPEADDVFDYLRGFFNKLVDLYRDEFKFKIQESKKLNSLNDEKMFIVYTIIAKKLEENDNWRKDLETIMKNIDFNNDKLQEYLSVAPRIIDRKFNRYFKMANDIVEVIINVK